MPAVKQERHSASGDSTLDVEFSVDRVEMSVAERVYATLVVTARPEAVITLPDVGSSDAPSRNAAVTGGPTPGTTAKTLGDFTVVSAERTEHIEGAKRQTTLRVVLEPFLAGTKTIPPLEVKAKDGGKGFSVRTEAVSVNVLAAAAEKNNAQTPLEPARGPVALMAPAEKRLSRPMIIGGAAATVAVLAAFGFVIAHSRGRKRGVTPLVRVLGGFDRVREMLAADGTRSGALAAASLLHEAFTEYLRDELAIPADTHTGRGLVAAVERTGTLTPAARADLVALTSDMERIRFAPDVASAAGVEQIVTRCAAWIDCVHATTTGGHA
jgi:hypothetical protein